MTFDTSVSRVGASKRVILVVPMILTTVPLAPEMYSAAFSLTGSPWASAYFLVSRVMAMPVLTIRRPLVASPLG